MKRRWIGLLGALLLGIGALAFFGQTDAQEVHAEGEHVHCVCGGAYDDLSQVAKDASGHVCQDVEWTAWNGTLANKPTTAGDHYVYLTADATWVGQFTLPENMNLHICLNGHTITRESTSTTVQSVTTRSMKFFLMAEKKSNLDICDCVGTGRFAYSSKNTNQYHGTDMTFLQTRGTSVINYFGGTVEQATQKTDTYINPSDSTKKTDYNDSCGAIRVNVGTTFSMYGGTITGSKHTNASGGTCGFGGCMLISDGVTVNMYGGTFIGGEAGSAGAIRVRGIFNMYGGTIRDGKTTNSGGNLEVFSLNATYKDHIFNMYGGEIKDGQAGVGGNIRLVSYSGSSALYDIQSKMNMYGGTISGGKATSTDSKGGGGNIALVGGKYTSGGVSYYSTTQLTISGDARIENGQATGNAGGNIMIIGYKNGSDKITMSGNAVITGGSAKKYGGNVALLYGSDATIFEMNGGEISNGSTEGYGGNVAVYLVNYMILKGGAIKNGTVTSSSFAGAGVATSSGITSFTNDDNGWGGNIGIYGNGAFVMQDGEVSGGRVTASGTGVAFGGNIGAVSNVNSSKALNRSNIYIFGGLIKNGIVESTSTTTQAFNCYGANIAAGGPASYYTDGQANLYIHGGTITQDNVPGKTPTYGAFYRGTAEKNAHGGNIVYTYTNEFIAGKSRTVNGQSYTGGPIEISNGYAYSAKGQGLGGNIFQKETSINMDGATIKGGTASHKGGNIYFNTNVTGHKITNSTITNGSTEGTGDNGGGNIYMGNGKLTLTNTEISNGTTKAKGGNIYIAQQTTVEVVMQSGAILNGTSSANTGGNLFVSGKFTMNGGEVSGGMGTSAGNVFINISNKDHTRGIVTLNGGTIKNGKTVSTAGSGANIIVNGTAAYYGGRLIINNGTIEMEDSCPAGSSSGNNIVSYGYVEMNGGKIIGGKSTTAVTETTESYGRGAALYLRAVPADSIEIPSFVMTGGEISGGTALYGGGNVFVGAGVPATISGGLISGGTVLGGTLGGETGSYGGNIWNVSENLKINGTAEIADGSAIMGGNIYVSRDTALEITGSPAFTGGNASKNGGNLLVAANATVTISGTPVFDGGKAGNLGGNIHSDGNLTINGGTFMNGEAVTNGGNLRTGGGVTVINDGIFKDGLAKGDFQAFNAFFVATKVTINGGQFLQEQKENINVWIHNGCSTESAVNGGYFEAIFHGSEKHSANLASVIHGGYFENAPEAFTIADGLAAVALSPAVTNEGHTYYYEVKAVVMALLSSRTTVLANNSIAALAGGGYVAPNTAFTISASEVPGYTFVGWWKNAYEGDAVSNSAEYLVEEGISTETNFIAVYTLDANLDTTDIAYKFDGANYTVKIGDAAPETVSGVKEGFVTAGTEITLNFIGNGFEYWMNGNKKIVSRDAEYIFTVYNEVEYAAANETATGTEIVFVSDSGQVLEKVVTSDALADLPAVPVKVGKENGVWNKTLDAINAAIEAGDSYVEVQATGYTAILTTYTITVQAVKEDGTAIAGVTNTITAVPGAFTLITAPATPAGMNFLYYAKGTEILSYNASFSMTATGDATINAVYGTETVEKAPAMAITMNQATAQGDGKFTLTVAVTRDLPEGYELIEQGILFVKSDAVEVVYGGTGVTKLVSTGTLDNGTTILNLRNAPSGAAIYAKGYMIVKKAGSENTDTDLVYTELAVCTAE